MALLSPSILARRLPMAPRHRQCTAAATVLEARKHGQRQEGQQHEHTRHGHKEQQPLPRAQTRRTEARHQRVRCCGQLLLKQLVARVVGSRRRAGRAHLQGVWRRRAVRARHGANLQRDRGLDNGKLNTARACEFVCSRGDEDCEDGELLGPPVEEVTGTPFMVWVFVRPAKAKGTDRPWAIMDTVLHLTDGSALQQRDKHDSYIRYPKTKNKNTFYLADATFENAWSILLFLHLCTELISLLLPPLAPSTPLVLARQSLVQSRLLLRMRKSFDINRIGTNQRLRHLDYILHQLVHHVWPSKLPVGRGGLGGMYSQRKIHE